MTAMQKALEGIDAKAMRDPTTARLMELAYAAGLGAAQAGPKGRTKGADTYKTTASDRKMRDAIVILKNALSITGPDSPDDAWPIELVEFRESGRDRGWNVVRIQMAEGPRQVRIKIGSIAGKAVDELMSEGVVVRIGRREQADVATISRRGLTLLKTGSCDRNADQAPRWRMGHLDLADFDEEAVAILEAAFDDGGGARAVEIHQTEDRDQVAARQKNEGFEPEGSVVKKTLTVAGKAVAARPDTLEKLAVMGLMQQSGTRYTIGEGTFTKTTTYVPTERGKDLVEEGESSMAVPSTPLIETAGQPFVDLMVEMDVGPDDLFKGNTMEAIAARGRRT